MPIEINLPNLTEVINEAQQTAAEQFAAMLGVEVPPEHSILTRHQAAVQIPPNPSLSVDPLPRVLPATSNQDAPGTEEDIPPMPPSDIYATLADELTREYEAPEEDMGASIDVVIEATLTNPQPTDYHQLLGEALEGTCGLSLREFNNHPRCYFEDDLVDTIQDILSTLCGRHIMFIPAIDEAKYLANHLVITMAPKWVTQDSGRHMLSYCSVASGTLDRYHTTPHRFLSKVLSALSLVLQYLYTKRGWTDKPPRMLSLTEEKERKMFGDKIAALSPVAKLKIYTDCENIEWVYQNSDDGSCMRYDHEEFRDLSEGEHPTHMYGNSKDGKFGLLTAYSGGRVIARAVANTETRIYGRVFGEDGYMAPMLKADDAKHPDLSPWEQKFGALEGLEFWLDRPEYVDDEHDSGGEYTGDPLVSRYIAPYIDRGLTAGHGAAHLQIMREGGRAYAKVLCADDSLKEAAKPFGGLKFELGVNIFNNLTMPEGVHHIITTSGCYTTGTVVTTDSSPMVWTSNAGMQLLHNVQWVQELGEYLAHDDPDLMWNTHYQDRVYIGQGSEFVQSYLDEQYYRPEDLVEVITGPSGYRRPRMVYKGNAQMSEIEGRMILQCRNFGYWRENVAGVTLRDKPINWKGVCFTRGAIKDVGLRYYEDTENLYKADGVKVTTVEELKQLLSEAIPDAEGDPLSTAATHIAAYTSAA